MVNKYELIIQIAKKFNATLDSDIKSLVRMYDLEHILLESLEGYTLVDTKKLKDKLNVVEVKLPTDDTISLNYAKLQSGLKLEFMVDKEEFEKAEFKKYIEEYMKNVFIDTLDSKVEDDKLNEKVSDQAKLFKLLEKRGINTYKKAKDYFEIQDLEASWRTSEALDEYYHGGRY